MFARPATENAVMPWQGRHGRIGLYAVALAGRASPDNKGFVMIFGVSSGMAGLAARTFIVAAMGCAVGFAATGPVHAQQAAQAGADDPVVARVNGQPILRSEVLIAAESLPPQLRAVPIEALYPALLNQLIDRKLTVAQAEKEKFDKDPTVEKRVEDIRERVIEQLYLSSKIEKGLTDDMLKAEYDKLPTEKRVRASHILVKTRDEAIQVIRDLNAGQKFEDIAAKKSLDPSGKQGGDLGYFSKDQMVASFANAAFSMKKGEISKAPVQSEYGWHIIRVDDIQENAKPSFEEKKGELRDQLSDAFLAGQVEEMRKGAKIERFAIDGSPAPAGDPQPGR
jgi:peptidyl-prolyl cis-trans isomerase C